MKRFAVLAACLVILPSCGGGGSSPKASYEGLQNAVEGKDWGKVFSCFHPDESDQTLAVFTGMAGTLAATNQKQRTELDELMQKDGAQAKAGADQFKDVKDKAGYVTDLMEWMAKFGDKGMLAAWDSKATLKDIKDAGETATATVVKGGKYTGQAPIKFRKKDGNWYVSVAK